MLTIENKQVGVEIAFNGQRLLRYQAVTPASKPYFDWVGLPPGAGERFGENIALAAPHDHVWHLGLFYAQKFVDGRNFWESEYMASRNEPYGHMKHQGVLNTYVRNDGSVGFGHEIRWLTSDTHEQWMNEAREVAVRPPSGNMYRIDWTLTLTALGKDRVWTSKSPPGDYSGLSYRSLRSMDNGEALNSEGGKTLEAVHNKPARWADYTGKLDGKVDFANPDKAGITMLDHPSNPGSPVTWFCIGKPFGFLAANRTYGIEWTLKKDQPVKLRYAVLVHFGPPDPDAIEAEYKRYAS